MVKLISGYTVVFFCSWPIDIDELMTSAYNAQDYNNIAGITLFIVSKNEEAERPILNQLFIIIVILFS